MRRLTTSRNWAAVTGSGVVGRAEPLRVLIAVHQGRPDSNAATNEYGHPGIIRA